MKPKLFLIEYEGSQWCGGRSTCVVLAFSESHAEELAANYMEESMRDLFSDEYNDLEDDGYDDGAKAYTVNSVKEFGPDHDQWKFFMDENQRNHFYPCIGFEFKDIVK